MITRLIETKNKALKPTWLMRQAGRYLPEYKEERSKIKDFLKACQDTHFIKTVTKQPIERFGFDAAIIFSDILLLPYSLGFNIKFEENIGPIVEFKEDINNCKLDEDKLNPMLSSITDLKSELSSDVDLIGFAGSPWTVACYLIEGKGSKDFSKIKAHAYNDTSYLNELIEILVENTIIYLSKQIEAGATIIKLFDSWAGCLPRKYYQKYIINPNKLIIKALKEKYDVPIIAFPRLSGNLYIDFVRETNVDVIALDYLVEKPLISSLHSEFPNLITQGSLDPIFLLLEDKAKLEKEILEVLDSFKEVPHIFNLGHGILPNTPVGNVNFLIEVIRNYGK